ncbi:hypothetical protein [Methylobacterium oryzisoli]|uniref:hypothetical protein n=1 Tax=Methylobacterium oryzisoli TaxID=3385502 RepID=UPI003891FF3F
MKTPILHRHADGTAHYSHCYAEYAPTPHRFAWQAPRRTTPVGRRVRIVLTTFVLAAAVFWATMPTTPPNTHAKAPAALGTHELSL